ncbi:hypothetical protein GCM10029992_31780 [Glycomyces albus]
MPHGGAVERSQGADQAGAQVSRDIHHVDDNFQQVTEGYDIQIKPSPTAARGSNEGRGGLGVCIAREMRQSQLSDDLAQVFLSGLVAHPHAGLRIERNMIERWMAYQ